MSPWIRVRRGRAKVAVTSRGSVMSTISPSGPSIGSPEKCTVTCWPIALSNNSRVSTHTTGRARHDIFWGQADFGKIGALVHRWLLGRQGVCWAASLLNATRPPVRDSRLSLASRYAGGLAKNLFVRRCFGLSGIFADTLGTRSIASVTVGFSLITRRPVRAGRPRRG